MISIAIWGSNYVYGEFCTEPIQRFFHIIWYYQNSHPYKIFSNSTFYNLCIHILPNWGWLSPKFATFKELVDFYIPLLSRLHNSRFASILKWLLFMTREFFVLLWSLICSFWSPSFYYTCQFWFVDRLPTYIIMKISCFSFDFFLKVNSRWRMTLHYIVNCESNTESLIFPNT